MSKILLINDFVSKGKIAGNIMDACLSYKLHQCYFLPTALISHNFSLGNIAKLDTSSYIKDCLDSWDKLGFTFDIIFIGYVENKKQKDLIIDYINKIKYNPLIVLDPIMGDDGKLYKNVNNDKLEIYKDLLKIAHIIIPNSTEAKFLGLCDFDKLLATNKKYLITSLDNENKPYNLAIDKDLYKVYYNKIDLNYGGTGDLFDSLFLDYYIKTKDLKKSMEFTTEDISKILEIQKKKYGTHPSLAIESILCEIYGGKYAWKKIL